MKNINNNKSFVKLDYTQNIIALDKNRVELNYIVDITFGEWLHRLRKAQDLSQDDLASRSRVTKSYISKLEKNQINQPRLHQIEKICKALNVSFDEAKRLLFMPKGITQTETQKLAEKLASGAMASGFDDLHDEQLREDFLADMLTIAESMLKRKLQEQEKRKESAKS